MKTNIIFLVFFIATGIHTIGQSVRIVSPTCEYRKNPIGIDAVHPRLSWKIQSSVHRNVVQTAYHILVADSPEKLAANNGNIWDSKKINSNQSIQIIYNGLPLQSAKKYYWKVKVWTNYESAETLTAQSFWQMGLLTDNDWHKAQWIAYEVLPDSTKILPFAHGSGKKDWGKRKDILPLFRKEFSINKTVKQATMFISGLGQFEMSINGKKTGDNFLDPGWTLYTKQALYVTFNVTEQIKKGNNAIGVMLGNGFYYIPSERYRKVTGAFGYPKMICRLFIEYVDGSIENIISDESWKTAPSPIIFSSIYGGEDYDANLEQQGWDKSLFNDASWKNAVAVNGHPLQSQMQEPIKIQQIFSPTKTTQLKENVYVFDMSQNMSGIPQITVQGKKGDTVKITTAELLTEDGKPNQKATGNPSFYQYILKGNGIEKWQPRFSYYGYRYVQVENAVIANATNSKHFPVILAVKGLHISNNAERVGSFSSSSELFNKTDKLIDWSIKSNMVSVFTDCPHREKLGWLEQNHLVGSSIKNEYNIATLLRKVISDMRFSQNADGLIPEIAPEFVHFEGGFLDSPEWGSAAIILPWYVYLWYGDKNVLEESYPMMQKYMAYLQTKAKDNILTQGLGDWYDIGPKPPGVSQLTPRGLTATAISYYDYTILVQVAKLLNKYEDTLQYNNKAKEVKVSFNKMFFNDTTKQYGTGSQTANAIAVYMQLVDEKDKLAVIENIVKDIRSRSNALTAGDIGYRYLLKVLDDAGRSDVIFDMNNKTNVPGYGYQLAHGATALTESWQAASNASNNHFMLGHIMEWFYGGLGGIKQEDNSVAFNKILIHPEVVGGITEVKTKYECPYGTIVSEWNKTGKQYQWKIEVPCNTTARVELIGNKIIVSKENNKPLDIQKELHFIKKENGRLIYQIGSGNYEFTTIN